MLNLVLPFAFLFSSWSFADNFYIEEIKSADVAAQDKSTIRELIRLSIPEAGTHKSVSQASQADWIITPQLIKLGGAYILNLEKKSTKDKSSFSEKMKSASMDDLDVTAQRLTIAVIHEQRVQQTADVTNITEQEKKQNINRIEATRQWIVGLGPSWTSGLNSSGNGGFTLLIGYEWGLDPDYSVDLSYIGHSGRDDDDSRFSDFSVGGTYYLSRTKYSPFLTARIGYGSAEINDGCNFFCTTDSEDPGGWTTSVAAGMKFFRTSSVNVSTYLRYTYMFDQGPYGHADMTTFMVAVHF